MEGLLSTGRTTSSLEKFTSLVCFKSIQILIFFVKHNLFAKTIWHNIFIGPCQGCWKWQDGQGNLSSNCLLSDSLGLWTTLNLKYCPIVGQLFMQMVVQRSVQQFSYQTVLCLIVQCFDSAVSNSPMVGQWYVQHSDGCYVQQSDIMTVLFPTFQCLECAVSNSPMDRQCCVKLSDGLTVLCPTVHRSNSAVSNCIMVWQCCVQPSNGLRLRARSLNSKSVSLYQKVLNILSTLAKCLKITSSVA